MLLYQSKCAEINFSTKFNFFQLFLLIYGMRDRVLKDFLLKLFKLVLIHCISGRKGKTSSNGMLFYLWCKQKRNIYSKFEELGNKAKGQRLKKKQQLDVYVTR